MESVDSDENDMVLCHDLPGALWPRDAGGNPTIRNDRLSVDGFVARTETGRD